MTIKDIAKLANVSPGTVSKIINGKADNIRPATREKVLNIVRQYHYSPGNFIRQSSLAMRRRCWRISRWGCRRA